MRRRIVLPHPLRCKHCQACTLLFVGDAGLRLTATQIAGLVEEFARTPPKYGWRFLRKVPPVSRTFLRLRCGRKEDEKK